MPDMPKGLTNYRIRMDMQDVLRMTCVNANCLNERNGWVIVLDPTNDKHIGAEKFIEQDSGRKYARILARDGAAYIDKHGAGLGVDLVHLRQVVARALPLFIVHVFPPGQQCFVRHLDREIHFSVATRERERVHSKPLEWNEDFNGAADRYAQAVGRK